MVRPADRQSDEKDLAAADFQAGHAHDGRAPAGVMT
jgi:hypothetical protein